MTFKVLLIVGLFAAASATSQDHGHNPQNIIPLQGDKHTKVSAHQEFENHGHKEYYQKDYHGHHKEHSGHASSAQSIKLYDDGHLTKHVEYHGHPKYDLEYEVKDPHTHDFKYQQETRDGDNINGVYSLRQPDGVIRIVKYHSDKKNGFNAEVEYVGHAKYINLEDY